MATKADIETDLTLEIDGATVTPEKFLRGVQAFFGLVTEITKHAAGEEQPVQWLVQVKQGSNLVGLVPRPGFNPTIVSRVLDLIPEGIVQLEASEETPPGFGEGALRRARDLSRVADGTDDDEMKVRVWVRKAAVPITQKAAAHISSILRTDVEDYGSIEGRLQVVSERRGLHVIITEPLWSRPIRCNVKPELMQEALSFFGRRVEAYGMIHYRRDGTASSIDVEEFVPFPEAAEIPSFEQVRGILRDI